MMDDRKLLELAAMACGFVTSHRINRERLELDPPVIGLWIDGVSTNWNPLEDSGHALNLAVLLHLGISVPPVLDGRVDVVTFRAPTISVIEYPETGENRTAVARRAIVRAAAEIGKSCESLPEEQPWN